MHTFKRFSLLVLIASVGIFNSCEKENNDLPEDTSSVGVVGDTCITLLAGQFIDVGSVCMEVSDSNLCVSFHTDGDWSLEEVQLWVGTALADLPVNNAGNPIIGQFPYKADNLNGQTDYQFCIPLADLGIVDDGTCLYNLFVAAHATVSNGMGSETAWSDGIALVDQGSWATYSPVTLSCDPSNTVPSDCETAFAFGDSLATCFLNADFDQNGQADGFNRWGWTNYIETPGLYTFELWAAAGNCELNKGTLVGTVSVNYDGSMAMVSINMDSPYALNETQLYLGSDPLPKKNGSYTVAPGLYPNKHNDLTGATTDEYIVDGLNGPVYLVFHAVVCGF